MGGAPAWKSASTFRYKADPIEYREGYEHFERAFAGDRDDSLSEILQWALRMKIDE